MREELRRYWENEFTTNYQQLNGGTDPETEKYFAKIFDGDSKKAKEFLEKIITSENSNTNISYTLNISINSSTDSFYQA